MDFKDTSLWEKKNNSTIIYRYDYQGDTHQGELEKEPSTLFVSIGRLSVNDRTSWELADGARPEIGSGFRSHEYISATGRLTRSRIHAFIIGESSTCTCDQIEISIRPTSLDDLLKTSKHQRWSLLNSGERPEEGWLKDEMGVIHIADTAEPSGKGTLLARLYTDESTFAGLVQKIKSGLTLRSAHLEILADLFQFPYDHNDYGMLRERNDKSMGGYARARLEEVVLEWAPKLDTLPSDRNSLNLPIDVSEDLGIADYLSRLASDVKSIRERVDIFFGVAIGVALIYAAGPLLDWLGIG